MTHRQTILIIDVATSGYTPEKDTILEVACILLDAGTLEVLDTTSSTVRHEAGSVTAPDFHEALLRECADPEQSNSMQAVEGRLLAGPWTTADVVCNRALDFDLKFLAKHMPTLYRALLKNKPQLELKALDVLHRATGKKPFKAEGDRSYRAVDDAIAAYEELCFLTAHHHEVSP